MIEPSFSPLSATRDEDEPALVFFVRYKIVKWTLRIVLQPFRGLSDCLFPWKRQSAFFLRYGQIHAFSFFHPGWESNPPSVARTTCDSPPTCPVTKEGHVSGVSPPLPPLLMYLAWPPPHPPNLATGMIPPLPPPHGLSTTLGHVPSSLSHLYGLRLSEQE